MKLKLNGIILLEAIFITTLQASIPIRRFWVVEGESGRYLGETNSGNKYICHYYESGPENNDFSSQCYNQNKNYSSGKLAYVYRGPSYPACPPLPRIKNGYWKCPVDVFSNSVEVYASCAAQCFHGYTASPTEEIVVRCPESLRWEKLPDFQCIIKNDICQLWNLSVITSKPFQVIISWNVTTACQEHNLTLVLVGPRETLTKTLQRNTTFIVVKDVDLDTSYEVYIYNQEKELANGKFRSAARVSPAKDVQVHIENTTAVSITWEAPVNDSSVICYMVNITDGDSWFNLNTSATRLVASKLKTGMNYTITVTAFNQYSRSEQSDSVYIELPEESDGDKNNNDNAATVEVWILGLFGGLVAVILVFFIIIMVKRWKLKRRSQYGSTDEFQLNDQNSTLGNGLKCQNNSLVRYESRIEDSTSSPLLGQHPQNLSGTSQESNTTPPTLDVISLESPQNSLNLSEAESLDPQSLLLGEEASDYPCRSDSENSGNSGADFSGLKKEVTKKWQRSGIPRKDPGSDSGRGSETGTCSTVSDGDDSPNRSSKSSQNSSSSRRSRQMNYSHQDSTDSGRVSEGETAKDSTGGETIISVEVHGSCLTDISERSVEEDISVEIPVSIDNEPVDPEKCSCTFSKFSSTVDAKYVHDLGDLLDPHGYYSDRKSWKSLTENVLNFKNERIVAMQHRTKKTFEEEVLPHLQAKGKKLGHLVLHFSHEDHFRKDVLELMQKIHLECVFCDKIFVKSLGNNKSFKE